MLEFRLTVYYTGPGVYAGRPIAQFEMRLLFAELIRRFDMRFAPGMTTKKWEDNLADKDALTRGALWLNLRERSNIATRA